MSETNRQWILVKRPEGRLTDDCFELRETSVPEIGDGQFLVRNRYLSCDPAQRGWMETDTYIPKVPLGSPMHGATVGEVVASKHPAFAAGDRVQGGFGWQEYTVSEAKERWPVMKLPDGVDFETSLSLFGITGFTAYFGMTGVGGVTDGDVAVVSGAAGATGSVASQIAKALGARVIGVAGGERKTRFLTETLGLDGAIDYKHDDLRARLRELAPKGVDLFFDNVGGETLEAVLDNLAIGARIVVCGVISALNDPAKRGVGIRNHGNLIIFRASMRGFIVSDFMNEAPAAAAKLGGWVAEGKIKNQLDVVDGFENAPAALRGLFEGENLGKRLVRL